MPFDVQMGADIISLFGLVISFLAAATVAAVIVAFRAILPVVCGLGKWCLILGLYPEQCELSFLLCDGLKTTQHPQATNYW
ncbi:MAG: hypothetical protein J2P37_19155 [Ktedonobacteraceae bacterium]|nr:hypothetical protein [Ktedonobacteraceae bacterium]